LTQTLVIKKVRTAQDSRRRAAELLDAAKRAVEIAIETDEAAAIEFLNKETTPQ
jgi:type I restriction enzyme S subunit